MTPTGALRALAILSVMLIGCGTPDEPGPSAAPSGPRLAPTLENYGSWMQAPSDRWPRLALVNRIQYDDADHPIAGSGFLLDTGDEVLAATAKHVLSYFKSGRMDSVSFDGSLKAWHMFPKDSPGDLVVIDELIHEDAGESLEGVPAGRDWLLFTVKERSEQLQPLRFRRGPLTKGEPVFVVGWTYREIDRPQLVREGEFVRRDGQTLLIDVKALSRNKVGGLSGCPVLDAEGYLIGLMSQGYGELSRVSAIDYPTALLAERAGAARVSPRARRP